MFCAGVFLCISFALVGGAFDGTLSYVGLWYWWFAETSSYYGITTGARLLRNQ